MESGAIPDSGINSSSFSTTSIGFSRVPQHARFGQDDYWSNDQEDSQPWIQVDFGSSRRVTGLQTEGHSGSKYGYIVIYINVKVGMLETELAFIENESGETKVGSFIDSLCSEHFCKKKIWPRLMVQEQYAPGSYGPGSLIILNKFSESNMLLDHIKKVHCSRTV